MRRDGLRIGFVPTMGALHAGHRALICAARRRCDALAVSIFVNPTQFGPKEDLSRYPRPITKDRALCRAEGVDLCFEPTARMMYPPGFQTTVSVPSLARRWEGAARPHHFTGVATVVTKLFSIVQPHEAFFGQKDFQQAAIVRRLVKDLNLDIEIIVRPTVREPDGLAMSSRNVYLTPEERRQAVVLYESLQAGRDAIRRGVRNEALVRRAMHRVVQRERTVTVDYLAVCDPVTLEPLRTVDRQAVLLGAIRLGAVRLIDNLVVTPPARRR